MPVMCIVINKNSLFLIDFEKNDSSLIKLDFVEKKALYGCLKSLYERADARVRGSKKG